MAHELPRSRPSHRANGLRREILEHARRLRNSQINWRVPPRTDRNKLVEDHYSKLGFTLIPARTRTPMTNWELDVDPR